jgi:hypothetical protein
LAKKAISIIIECIKVYLYFILPEAPEALLIWVNAPLVILCIVALRPPENDKRQANKLISCNEAFRLPS